MKTKILAAVFLSVSICSQAAFVGIHAAAATDNVEAIRNSLAKDPALISARHGANRTPLCIATMRGQTNALEFLISQGADVNDKGFFDLTPLADMAMYGMTNDQRCAEVATLLFAHGAEVDPIDRYLGTPLLHAVESRKSKLARVLLEHGANQNITYKGANAGTTPLHMAVQYGDTKMVEVLMQFEPPLTTKNRDGATPLRLAEQLNRTEIAVMLRKLNPNPEPEEVSRYSTPPTKEEMRLLGKRIADGDQTALTELNQLAEKLYGEITDYQVEQARVLVLLFRMKAAFDLMGDAAGNNNASAFDALKACLKMRHLAAFAPDALGRAAAAGNKDALEILMNFKRWNILESSALFALCVPAKANVSPAVDYLSNWLTQSEPSKRDGIFMEVTNALSSASARGNLKAKSAMEKLGASVP